MSRPRLGFLGTGWIGRHRMAAIAGTGTADIAWLCDPDSASLAEAQALAPGAAVVESLDAMLAHRPDGVVIATPSAQHAQQGIAALEAGAHVFCQKPLGRDAQEVAAVVAAARRADRRLGVDFSYRETAAVRAIRELVATGSLGRILAVDAVFHNAYGPDKPWFYDRALSGGGCLIDLGIHLIDAALHLLDFPTASPVSAALWKQGEVANRSVVEDHALAELRTDAGTVIRVACSWGSHAGRDADIRIVVHGSDATAALTNVGGSFYDLAVDLYSGTDSKRIVAPPDAWGGRAAERWASALASTQPQALGELVTVAALVDAVYAQAYDGVGGAPVAVTTARRAREYATG